MGFCRVFFSTDDNRKSHDIAFLKYAIFKELKSPPSIYPLVKIKTFRLFCLRSVVPYTYPIHTLLDRYVAWAILELRKHYEGHFIFFFHFLPRSIEDSEGWINKRKCKPKKNNWTNSFPKRFCLHLTLVNQEKTSEADILAVCLGLSWNVTCKLQREGC